MFISFKTKRAKRNKKPTTIHREVEILYIHFVAITSLLLYYPIRVINEIYLFGYLTVATLSLHLTRLFLFI